MDTIWNGDDEKHVLPSRCINLELICFWLWTVIMDNILIVETHAQKKGWHRIAFKKKKEKEDT